MKKNPGHVSKDRGIVGRFKHMGGEGGIQVTSSNWRNQIKEKQGVHRQELHLHILKDRIFYPLLSHPPSYTGTKPICIVYEVSKNTVSLYSEVLLFVVVTEKILLTCLVLPPHKMESSKNLFSFWT